MPLQKLQIAPGIDKQNTEYGAEGRGQQIRGMETAKQRRTTSRASRHLAVEYQRCRESPENQSQHTESGPSEDGYKFV